MDTKTKQFLKDAAELIGIVLALLIYIALIWLYLVATPDQFSAECEILRAERFPEHLQIRQVPWR